jgi:hypothetical protein
MVNNILLIMPVWKHDRSGEATLINLDYSGTEIAVAAKMRLMKL